MSRTLGVVLSQGKSTLREDYGVLVPGRRRCKEGEEEEGGGECREAVDSKVMQFKSQHSSRC